MNEQASSQPLYVELYKISQCLRGLAHLFTAYSESETAFERLEDILAAIGSLIEDQGECVWRVAQRVEDLET